MPAARIPLTLDRHGTFDVTLYWTADDGTPKPIGAAYTAVLTVVDGMTGEPAFSLTSAAAGGITIEPNADQGAMACTITAGQGVALDRTGMYLLQLLAVDDSGDVVDVAYGPVRLGARWPILPMATD